METIISIITTQEQLEDVVNKAFEKVYAQKIQPVQPQTTERKAIRSIQQGADFIGSSKPKFQALKNSGTIRFYQSGRKFIIWTDELLQDLQKPIKTTSDAK
jgi:hypothetical protein